MAFNTSALLPHLYQVHKNIQYMERYYGDRVFAKTIEKPESATGQSPAVAPKNRIVNFLIRCGDSLFQYSRVRKSLIDTRKARVSTATFYFVLAVLMMTLILLVIGGLVFMVIWDAIKGTEKIDWSELFQKYWRHGYYCLVAILVFAYVVSIAAIIYKKNLDIYNQLYNPDVMINGSEHISDVVKMMHIAGFNGETPSKIETNNVMMYYYYFNIRNQAGGKECPLTLVNLRSIHNVAPTLSSGCINVNAKADKEGYEDDDEEEKDPLAGCCNLQDKSEDKVIKSCFLCDSVYNGQKYIAPFHPGMDKALWSMKLYRQLQRYDVPGMARRLRNAMDYFKMLLLRRFDSSASGMTLEEEKQLVNTVTNIITMPGAELIDLAIADLTKATKLDESEVKTIADCYAVGLADPSIVLVYFDKTNNVGYTMTSQQLAETYLRYDSNGYSSGGVYLCYSETAPLYVTIVGNNRNQSYFSTYFKRECAESNNRFGCSWAFIGNNPRSSVVPGTSKMGIDKWTPDYTELLKDSTSTTSSSSLLGGSGHNNLFAVTIPITELIKQKRAIRNSMVIDAMKDTLPTIIAEEIIALDPQGNWTLADAQTEKILQDIQYKHPDFKKEWHVYNMICRDMLTNTSAKLISLRAKTVSEKSSEPKSTEKSMYITQEQFADIVKKMSREEFMGQFMFYLDELRTTSDGLSNLYRQFDYSRKEHNTNQLVLNMTTAFSLIIAIMVLGEFGHRAYKEMEKTVLEETKKLDEIADDKKRKLKQQDIQTIKINFYIKVAVSVAAIVITLSMIQAFRQKSDDLFEYNTSILNRNGAIITNTADEMFKLFFDSVMGSAKGANSNDDDLMYQRMFTLKRSSADPAMAATLISKFEHERFIEMLNAYDKCNILFSTSETLVPFPMLEVSIYTVLIVFLLIIMIVVTLALDPKDRVVRMRKLVLTKARLEKGVEVYDSEVTACDNELEKKKIENLVKFIAIVLLVILPIMFAVSLSQNTATFLSTLYLSDYYTKSDCYST